MRTVLFVSISGTDNADEAETGLGLWAGLPEHCTWSMLISAE
jgi:hypothetical protein